MVARLSLLILLLIYFCVGGLYVVNTPAWQVPDEPAHYNYVRYVAEHAALPVLRAGDYDALYLERLKSQHFPGDLSIAAVRYESWQPPLYYALAAPVFALTGGQVGVVRFFSLALGGLGVVLVYALARRARPHAPGLALAAAGFWAFVPQHLAMLAGINNDSLAEVIMLLGVWRTLETFFAPADFYAHDPGISAYLAAQFPVAQHRPPLRHLVALGVVLGLGFWTKLSIYPLAGVVGAALLLWAKRERWAGRVWLNAALWVVIPAVLIGGLWWGRNVLTYGGLDVFGSQRHDAIVVGQLRASEALAQWGPERYLSNFAQITFQSFWGQFGWMGVVMDRRVYDALKLYSLLLGIGAAGWIMGPRRVSPAQRDLALVLGLTLLLAIAVYLYYNLTFVQFQGRYVYPALSVIALGAALSLRQWAVWIVRLTRLPRAWVPAALFGLPLLPVAAQMALTVFALYRFIIPALVL
jgi:4-amino-4-deoxy-L-arabinose transferase-like glycosyltransferase